MIRAVHTVPGIRVYINISIYYDVNIYNSIKCYVSVPYIIFTILF